MFDLMLHRVEIAFLYTVKPCIQEHPFSGFRLIGFLYIGYFIFFVVHLLYTASEITSIYTEILVQYHSKVTDTVLLN